MTASAAINTGNILGCPDGPCPQPVLCSEFCKLRSPDYNVVNRIFEDWMHDFEASSPRFAAQDFVLELARRGWKLVPK